MDATSVHLDGNNMSELVNPGFIGRRRITTVFLNNSQIRVVTNYSLEGLTEVRYQVQTLMVVFWLSQELKKSQYLTVRQSVSHGDKLSSALS